MSESGVSLGSLPVITLIAASILTQGAYREEMCVRILSRNEGVVNMMHAEVSLILEFTFLMFLPLFFPVHFQIIIIIIIRNVLT